jgi:hypothetical protein
LELISAHFNERLICTVSTYYKWILHDKKITLQRTLAFTTTFLAAMHTHAGMGNIGTSYGVLPSDIASAQSLSMFNTQVSSSYYNPAYLVKDPREELTVGIMHSGQELRASSINRNGAWSQMLPLSMF